MAGLRRSWGIKWPYELELSRNQKKLNWSWLPKAFEALEDDHGTVKLKLASRITEITLVSPSGDDVYWVKIRKIWGRPPNIIVIGGEENKVLVKFAGREAKLNPWQDSEVDISNSDMPRNMLEHFKRILTYPEIAIGEEDESGSADMAKRMAKKIGWRVDAGGYVM